MGSAISSLVLAKLLEEIHQHIEDKHLEKVQQVAQETFKFTFQGKKELLIQPGYRLNLTSYKIQAPDKPSNLAMYLRRRLSNQKLSKIEQYDFDRVVTLSFTNNKLIIELFANGNMIFTDNDLNILSVLHGEIWKDRKIKRNEKYVYPKSSSLSPLTINYKEFETIFTKQDAVRSLAANLRIGGALAEEVCMTADIDKETKTQELKKEDKEKLYKALKKLFECPVAPVIQNNEVHAFPLKGVPVEKEFKTVNEAIDELFMEAQKSEQVEENSKVSDLEHRLKEQQESLEKFHKEIIENKEKGDLIYAHFQEIQQLISDKETKREKDGSIIVDL